MRPEIQYKMMDLEAKQIFSREKQQPKVDELEEERERLLQILITCYRKVPPPIREQIKEAIGAKPKLTRRQIEEEAEKALEKQMDTMATTLSFKKVYGNILYQEFLEAQKLGLNLLEYKKGKLEEDNLSLYEEQLEQENQRLRQLVEEALGSIR